MIYIKVVILVILIAVLIVICKKQQYVYEQYKNNNSVLFMIINMKKNKDRWKKINSSFKKLKKKYNCKYIRVEGISGKDMTYDKSAKQILKPRKYLLNKEFNCIESNDKWIYDGSISKSFPGLNLNGHEGYKGLALSNIKCFNLIKNKNMKYTWYCIVEDDAIFNEITYNKIINVITKNNKDDIIVLDSRGRSGTSAVLYNSRIIDKVINDLHPLSQFSIENEKKYKRGNNLWDWKLWVYLDNFNIKSSTYRIVKSGQFPSEISIK